MTRLKSIREMACKMKNKVIHIFGNDDPRINLFVRDIHKVIDKRARGIFQLATVLGALTAIQQELMDELK